jgi:hypothetical protein
MLPISFVGQALSPPTQLKPLRTQNPRPYGRGSAAFVPKLEETQ